MAGKIQNEDLKTAAELVAAGATAASLPNDTKIYVTANSINKQLSQAIIDGDIGGGGSGAKDYLGNVNKINGNGNFELGTASKWSLFTTTLTSLIPTGTITAGAASVTGFAISSTSPLAGLYSLRTSSSAAWSAGQGFISDAFTIDKEDQAKVLTFKVNYTVISGGTNISFSGTSTNSYAIYIYDTTASAWIQPSGVFSITQGTGSGYATGQFQTSSTSTQYRFAILSINSTAGAVTIDWDDISCCPSQYVYGSPVTDWQSYTPTWSSDGTVPTVGNGSVTGLWRRVGDSMEVRTRVNFGSTSTKGTGNYTISIPSGFTIDSTKVSSTSASNNSFGTGNYLSQTTTTASQVQSISYGTATTVKAGTDQNATSTSFNASQLNVFNATNDVWYTNFLVPITGWSSNVQMSDSADTRVVDFIGAQTSQAVTANVTNITFTTVKDSHGVWTGSTYVVIVPGDYVVNSSWLTSGTAAGSVYKDAAFFAYFGTGGAAQALAGSALVPCVAGTVLSVRSTGSVTVTSGVIGIYRLSGPSAISATETVAASYWLSANFTSSATIPVNFDSKEYDTHGAVTTSATAWKFTAPISGLYSVTNLLQQVTAAAGSLAITIYKNGSAYKIFAFQNGTVAGSNATLNLRLIASDYIDIRSSVSQAFIGGALATAFTSHVEITRVGN